MREPTLPEFLAAGFPADRGRPAFILPGGAAVSYGALEEGAGRVAALLAARGVRPGDRVAFQGPKCPEAVMVYLGVLRAGALFVPLNNGYTEAEVDYFLRDCEPALFVRDPVALVAAAGEYSPDAAPTPVEAGDLASLIY